MPWSLDWFAAEKLAKQGLQVRRVGWTDKMLIHKGALWYLLSGATQTVVTATEFAEAEFQARDWTDQPFDADPCKAAPAYNTEPIVYGTWTPGTIDQRPAPPPPGFPDPS